MGKTFAAIFHMLRQPPEIDEDDSEEEFNSQEFKSPQSNGSNRSGKNSRYGSSDYDNSDFDEIQSSEKTTESKRKRGKRRSIVGDLLHTLQKEKDEADAFESDIEIEGLVRPAEKCEFHRWSMLIEKGLHHILEPIDFTVRYSMNKDEISHADDPPKKELEVVIEHIDIKLQESQFGHIRSFILFINRYDRYDRARRMAGWRPKLSLRKNSKVERLREIVV